MTSILSTLKSKPALSALCLLGLCNTANAHTPYYLPNIFDIGDRGVVSLDATFGEEIFISDYPFDGSEYYIQTPSGNKLSPDTLTHLEMRTVIEQTLTEDGTYRFSTGWRENEAMRTYELNGRTRQLRSAADELPEGATLISNTQYILMAETYVTKGAPDENSLQALGIGLEFHPQTHPNDLFTGDDFVLQVLMNGVAYEGANVELHLAKRQPENSEPLIVQVSDEQGLVSFQPEVGGLYLIRSQLDLPAESETSPDISYVITLTVEVVE